jgi:hypothetical protein
VYICVCAHARATRNAKDPSGIQQPRNGFRSVHRNQEIADEEISERQLINPLASSSIFIYNDKGGSRKSKIPRGRLFYGYDEMWSLLPDK